MADNPMGAITDADRQAFQAAVALPGFFTMAPESQKKALRSVGVFSKANDTTLDGVLGSLKRAIKPEAQANPTAFTAPPPLVGAQVQPVGRIEGIREESIRGALEPVAATKPDPLQKAAPRLTAFMAGAQKGLADVGVNLTDPANLALIGGSFLRIPKAAKKFPKAYGIAKALVKGTFTTQMLGDLIDEVPEAKRAMARGDQEAAGRAVSKGIVDLMFLGQMAKDPVRRGIEKLTRPTAPPPSVPPATTAPPPAAPPAEPPKTGTPPAKGKVITMPRQPGLFEQPTSAPPTPGIPTAGASTPATAPPPTPSAPAQAQGTLANAATEAFGESLGQEYLNAIKSGDQETLAQMESMLSPEQRKPLEAARGSAPAPVTPIRQPAQEFDQQATDEARELGKKQLPQLRREQMLEENKPAAAPPTPEAEAARQKRVASIAEQLEGPKPAEVIPFPGKPTAAPIEAPAPVENPTSGSGRSRELWKPTEPVPPVGDVVPMDPKDIVADPKRFQFKHEAVGRGGTTPKLEDVEKFDPRKGGVIAVWKDPTDGKVYVVNGHHRLELAKRSAADRMNVQFLDSPDAQSAMSQGAMINIGEGQGTATDVAKLFRDAKLTPEDLKRENLATKSKLVTQGLALAKLDPSIFQTVVDGDITPEQGTLIGEKMGDNPVQQKKVAEYLIKKQANGETVKPSKLAEYLDIVRDAETKTETIATLFGDETTTSSLADDKADIMAFVKDSLGKEKRLFGTVGKKGAGETLARGGNVINEAESAKISEQASQALAVYDKLKLSAGPVSAILDEAARDLAAGGKSGPIKARAYERVRQAVSDILSGKPPGERPAGGDAGGPQGSPQAGGKGNGSGVGGGQARVTPPLPGFDKPAPNRLSGTGVAGPASPSPTEGLQPPTARPEPRRLRKPGTPPAKSTGGTGGTESAPALTSGGKVKLGADVKSLGEVLGSSLYSGKEAHIVTKELMQNAFDAVRGSRGGQVDVNVDSGKGTISIADNGKGMSPNDLATVFTDLGASGKRESAESSGGFGLAKAAPLMMSQEIEVQSVADVGGKRILSILKATPAQLLGEGVEIKQKVVSESVPTGTTVTSKLPPGARGWWEARQFVSDFQRSVKMPGKLVYKQGDYPVTMETRKPLKSLGKISVPGADVELYAGGEPKTLINSWGSVPIEINNNGIYQFESSLYLGGAANMKDVPSTIAADIRATVKEGHPDYPFTANREQMRGQAEQKIREFVKEKIVDPAVDRANAFIEQKYNSLPRVDSSSYDVALFDSGSRLTPTELKFMQTNPDVVNLAEEMAIVLDQSLDRLITSTKLPEDLKNVGEGIERAGIVLSKELHGVHVTNRSTKKATLFANPFSYAKGATPNEAASMLWHTIRHEILHDKIQEHGQSFTTGEVKIAQALGDLELEALLRLRGAYAAKGNTGKFRPGIDRALQIYRESRGRPERERDPFGGEESRTEHPVPGSVRGNAPAVSGSRKEPVRPSADQPRRAGPDISQVTAAPPGFLQSEEGASHLGRAVRNLYRIATGKDIAGEKYVQRHKEALWVALEHLWVTNKGDWNGFLEDARKAGFNEEFAAAARRKFLNDPKVKGEVERYKPTPPPPGYRAADEPPSDPGPQLA